MEEIRAMAKENVNFVHKDGKEFNHHIKFLKIIMNIEVFHKKAFLKIS